MGDLTVGQSAADDVYISGTVIGSFALTTSPVPVSGINLAGSIAITSSLFPLLDIPTAKVITWKGINTTIQPTESTPQFRTVWEFTMPPANWRPVGMYVWSETAGIGFRLAERITMWRAKWGAIGSPEVLGETTWTVSPGSPGLVPGSYYYKINAMTNAGPSAPTSSSVVIITPGSHRVRVTTPAQQKGVCWWGLYRTSENGIQGEEGFLAGIPAYAGISSVYDDVKTSDEINPFEGFPASDNSARQIAVSGTGDVEVSEVSCIFNEEFPQSQKIQFYYKGYANRKEFYEHDPGINTAFGDGFDLLINRDANATSDQAQLPRSPAIEIPLANLGSVKTYQRLFINSITNVTTSPAPTGAAFSVYGYRPLLYANVEVALTGVWSKPSFGNETTGETELVLQTTGTTATANLFVQIIFHSV